MFIVTTGTLVTITQPKYSICFYRGRARISSRI